MNKHIKDIDTYLALQPEDVRIVLQRLRQIIIKIIVVFPHGMDQLLNSLKMILLTSAQQKVQFGLQLLIRFLTNF